jgi:ribonuclease P protein component
LRFLAAEAGDEARRVAYAIPRKLGGAVVRNRLRRRLRAAVDQVVGEMAPGAYLISPQPAALDMDFQDLIQNLRLSVRAAGAAAGDPR